MTTVEQPVVTPGTGIAPERKGSILASWLSTTDHKIIGHLYLITSFGFFLIAGLMAMIMRAQLFGPDNHIVSDQQYNELFTMHGTIMLLLFATPLFVGFANEIMPLQIGSPDVAFPRLNLLSYYFFLFGGLILLISFLTPGGAASFGWYAYSPLTSSVYSPGIGGDMWIMGLALSGLGTILSGVNFITTIICMRAPGHDHVPDADLHLEHPAHQRARDSGVPGAGRGAAGAGDRPQARRAGVQRVQRRRDPVAEPVLVLRPSRGLHRRDAVLRHRHRGAAGVQPQADASATRAWSARPSRSPGCR